MSFLELKKIVLLLLLILIPGSVTPSFAQMENKDVHVHPATLGDRKPIMNFMLPEKIEANQDFTLSMTLYDEKNKKNFQHVTAKLEILRNDDKTSLMNALFYGKNGQIEIDFKYQSYDKPRIIVQAPQETFLGGYMSEFGSRIVTRQNVFTDGMYTLEATVVSIDSPAQFIDKEIVFNKEIQIGKNESQKSIVTGETSVTDSSKDHAEIDIPNWVRNNAKWWSNGEIDDKTFAGGIQYMIKEGIIKIPSTESEQTNDEVKIPNWVRNNAKWWSNGEIDDKTFADGIQYLVKVGIIRT